jgi:hypothetical protein
MSFGDDSGFKEDQIQCISYKQCDIFMLIPQFSRSNVKSSGWIRIRA